MVKLHDPPRDVHPQWYEAPTFYFSNPHSRRRRARRRAGAARLRVFDYELEVAAIIGRDGRDLDRRERRGHIVGYTIFNDWSARDLQFAEMQVGLGPAKGKDSAITLGPWIVTADELEPYRRDGRLALGWTSPSTASAAAATPSRAWPGRSRISSPTRRAARGCAPATCSGRAHAAAAALASCGAGRAGASLRRSRRATSSRCASRASARSRTGSSRASSPCTCRRRRRRELMGRDLLRPLRLPLERHRRVRVQQARDHLPDAGGDRGGVGGLGPRPGLLARRRRALGGDRHAHDPLGHPRRRAAPLRPGRLRPRRGRSTRCRSSGVTAPASGSTSAAPTASPASPGGRRGRARPDRPRARAARHRPRLDGHRPQAGRATRAAIRVCAATRPSSSSTAE